MGIQFDGINNEIESQAKIGFTGSGESSGLGTGLHWKILNQITLISETNIPIDNAENNKLV